MGIQCPPNKEIYLKNTKKKRKKTLEKKSLRKKRDLFCVGLSIPKS